MYIKNNQYIGFVLILLFLGNFSGIGGKNMRVKNVQVEPELLETVKNAVSKAAKDGRISCTTARKVAEEVNVPLIVVGKACDELKLKIMGCELGCF